MISGFDLLKYLTERFTNYINISPEEKNKLDESEETGQTGYTNHWFGILPFAVKSFINKNKSRK